MSQSLQTQLREKIDEAKRLLPMPQLLEKLGLGTHAKKEARCPFSDHEDKHPSFSIWDMGGAWFWKCHSKCGSGDEISFLAKYKGLSRSAAIALYLEMAGFPPCASHKSHEYLQSPASHESREYRGSLKSRESPECPVSPMSNGQGLQGELKDLAARNACTREGDRAGRKRFKLARDVRTVEKRIGGELAPAELMRLSDEWYRVSEPFLPNGETRGDHLEKFLAELTKVRVPTGEGGMLKKSLECVSKLSASELPEIPEISNTRESWRRIAALHRELSLRSTKENKTYFLSYRDATKASPGLNHQTAYNITLALARLGVIKIVCIGDARPGGKASTFRYLLPQTENGASEAKKAETQTKRAMPSSW